MTAVQDAAAMAGQEANRIHREMEKLKRKHETELSALQQTLQESRTKPHLCPMCVMAERVKFEFTEVEADPKLANSQSKSQYLRSLSTPGLAGSRSSWNSGQSGRCTREDEESIAGELEDRGNFLENLDFDEFVDEPL